MLVRDNNVDTINQKDIGMKAKCDICGRFIGDSEFDRDEIIVDFTPDTYHTDERTVFTHKNCRREELLKPSENFAKLIKDQNERTTD